MESQRLVAYKPVVDHHIAQEALPPNGFPYQPLDASQQAIRLLVLSPASFDDELKCSIRHASLKDSAVVPSYNTISYCWGEALDQTGVTIDGFPVSVPVATASALRHVRRADAHVVVWIDAICIDQTNVDERGQQVALMSAVYRKSVGNFICLGGDDPSVGPAIEGIHIILKQAYEEAQGACNFAKTCFDNDKNTLKISESLLTEDFNEVELRKFMSKPWFGRLWVFQEAALSPSNLCICGPYTVSLLDIIRAAVWIEYKKLSFPLASSIPQAITLGKYLWPFIDEQIVTYDNWRKHGADMATLWQIQRRLQCSDQRDRVFGMLGLSRFAVQHVGMPIEFSPDYTRPASEVLRDATRYMLSHYRNGVDLLRFVFHASERALKLPGKPSWMPRWRYAPTGHARAFNHHLFAAYTQTGWLPRQQDTLQNPDLLELRGITIDTISAASSRLPEVQDTDAATLRHWLDAVEQISFGDSEPETQELYTHSTVLLGGINWVEKYAERKDVAGYSHLKDFLASGQSLDLLDEKYNLLDEETTTVSRYFVPMMRCCGARKFFKTSRAFRGVGPHVLREGDIVVLIRGSLMPCVLRPRDPYYLFLGQCYVDGIMQGEAAADHKARNALDEVFVLE